MKKKLFTLLLALFAIAMTARAQNTINGHEYVDLGLPSGTLWATCNVGATKPEEYGDYFAWGEIESKNSYLWSTYKWCDGTYSGQTKYTGGTHGDGKKELDLEDDAAYVNWGDKWWMPSLEQQNELREKCTWEWTQLNGVNGSKVIGPNGNFIFLPAAGFREGSSLKNAGIYGYIQSRSDESGFVGFSDYLYFSDNKYGRGYNYRSDGLSVRPVAAKNEKPKPYAVWCKDNNTLYFLSSSSELKVGGTYKGYTISSLWSGEAVTNSPENKGTGFSPIAWMGFKTEKVVIEESFKDVLVNSTSAWFMGVESIEGLENLNTSNVTSMSFMFGSSKLTNLDLSHFDTRNVKYMQNMFLRCPNLASINLSHFDTQNVLNMHWMFGECTSLSNLDLSSFNTENVTDMGSMFSLCSNLTSLDVSGFNTEKVTDMGGMFGWCSNLTNLDVSKFETENVTDMSSMFSGCSSLTSLDVSGFNTEKVTNMHWMFSGCSSLTSLDVSGFNTENVTDMGSMFSRCSNLTNLDVSKFKTENVTDMSSMFSGCSSLTSLDVSGFNTENVTDMSLMFEGCTNLETLYASNSWSMSNVDVSYGMFNSCEKLVGGSGTVYNSKRTDGQYARIDGGYSNPGYFTDKNAYPSGILLNAANFPDDYLRQYVQTNYDLNRDGMLDQKEIAAIKEFPKNGISFLYGPNSGVADFTGIEHFTALESFWAYSYRATTLDLSKNKELRYVFYRCAQLNSINVSGCTKLDTLVIRPYGVSSIFLDELDVSKNTALTYLDCNDCNLTELDVSNNAMLKQLRCYGNQLKTLDVSQNTALTYLDCRGTRLWSSSDLPKNQLTVLDVSQNTALKELYCDLNQLTSLDVSKNTALTDLNCGGNQLTSLDVSQNTALTYLNCGYNQLTSLDVSKNAALTSLACSENPLYTIDVSKNTALESLSCESNRLTSLDVSKNTALTSLSCYDNQLASLDVSQNTALTRLRCYGNQLTSLDVSKNTALKFLYCGSNPLTSLDVSKNTALMDLSCNNNQLTSIDVSKNVGLEQFNCGGNQLTVLDVSKNVVLTNLECYNNQLTSIDIPNSLRGLNCNNNQLSSLELSQCTGLNFVHCYGNYFKGKDMDKLIEGLPIVEQGWIMVVNTYNSNETNVCTKAQVAAAKEKGWTVTKEIEGARVDDTYIGRDYEGSDPVAEDIDPVDEDDNIDFGSDMDENDDLNGNVIGDIFYNIGSGNGEYNAEEGCIVLKKTTDDETVDGLSGKDIFGEDFKGQFTGIVFKVPSGKGTVKVTAETTGNMLLKVKIGDGEPVEMELNGKLKISFPYNVSETTYVYIYAGAANEAKGFGAPASGDAALKIYGIEFERGETTAINNSQFTIDISADSWYTIDGVKLNGEPTKKGIYIRNGNKVVK